MKGLLQIWTVRNEDGTSYRDRKGCMVLLQSPLRDKLIDALAMKQSQVQGQGMPSTIHVRPLRIETLEGDAAAFFFQGREQFLEVN